MNSNKELSTLARVLRGSVLALMAVAALPTQAASPPTFWTGPETDYTQSVAFSPGQVAPFTDRDVLVPGASFTRSTSGSRHRPFNPSAGEIFPGGSSPLDMEWADATAATLANPSAATNLVYRLFNSWVGGSPVDKLDVNAVLHLKNENIYIAIKFTRWVRQYRGGSGFSYTRSTPAAAPPSPTVSITSPASGASFTTPANVNIAATATVSSGSVTNVAFFGNTTLLGSAQAAPFSITANNLAAGAYALTAVATSAGISSTSAMVNITVVSPPPTVSISITNPASGGVFAAPANVNIAATATVSSGSITNVAFFGNATSLGSVQAAPFSIPLSNLAAGAYALTAVATAAGTSSTSAVVNITIVSPIALSVSAPEITNGQFAFNYTADPGLTYVIQNSSNLVDWLPVATNVASSNPVRFTDSFISSISRFYRVGRLLNP